MIEKTAIGVQVLQHDRREAELRVSDGKIEIVRCEVRDVKASFEMPAVLNAQENFPVVIASVPGVDTFNRCWEFPFVESAQLEEILINRMEADLPVPVDQLTWGYRKNKIYKADKECWMACVQAARSQQVNRQNASLVSAGIRVDALTTEAEGIAALYRYGMKRPEGDGTDVLILAGGEYWLVAVIVEGLVKILRKFMRNGNADRLMLRQCLHMIEENISENPRQIFWAAEAENITFEDVQNAMQSDVVAIELSEKIVIGESVSPDAFVRFAPAIGLALAGAYERDQIVSFVGRKGVRDVSKYPRLEKWFSHPVRWSLAAAVMLILAGGIHLWALEWENQQMRSLLAEADQNNSAAVDLEQKVDAYNRLEEYRINVEGVLIDICRALPDNIVISSIQLSREKKLVIRGSAKDPKAVFSYADTLRKSNRLAAVQPEHTEPGRGGGFTVSAELIGVKSLNAFNGRGVQWK